jgi:hypothetical protein
VKTGKSLLKINAQRGGSAGALLYNFIFYKQATPYYRFTIIPNLLKKEFLQACFL